MLADGPTAQRRVKEQRIVAGRNQQPQRRTPIPVAFEVAPSRSSSARNGYEEWRLFRPDAATRQWRLLKVQLQLASGIESQNLASESYGFVCLGSVTRHSPKEGFLPT